MSRENTAEIVISARDEATAIIGNVASELGSFGGLLSRLATSAGPVGLALASIGAAAGGVTVLGATIASDTEELDRMSVRTGVSIEKLQVLRETIVENGGSADSLTVALSFLNRAIATSDPLLGKLGITGHDTYDVFMQLAKVLASSGDAAKKTEVAYQLLGRGSGDLIGSLGQIVGESAEVEKRMRAMGGIIEGSAAEGARKLDKQLDDLGRSTRSLLTNVGTFAVPAATLLVKGLNSVLEFAVEAARGIRDYGAALEELDAAKKSQGMVEPTYPKAWTDRDASGRLTTTVPYNVPTIGGVEVVAQGKKDPLANLNFDDGKESQREKRLKEIMRLLGQTRSEAETTLRSLEAIEDAKARTQIENALKIGPEVPRALDEYNRKLEATATETGGTASELEQVVNSVVALRTAGATLDLDSRLSISEEVLDSYAELVNTLGVARDRAQEYLTTWANAKNEEERKQARIKFGVETEKPYGPEVPEGGLPKTAASVRAEWSKTLSELTSAAGILDDTFSQVFNSLEQGFHAAFSGIVSGTMTVGAALKTMWTSVVDAILAELARIAAVAVIKLIAKAAGLPIVSSVASVPTTGSASAIAAAQQGTSNTNIFHISSFEGRDIVRELVSPSGRLRYGANQVTLVGEY